MKFQFENAAHNIVIDWYSHGAIFIKSHEITDDDMNYENQMTHSRLIPNLLHVDRTGAYSFCVAVRIVFVIVNQQDYKLHEKTRELIL